MNNIVRFNLVCFLTYLMNANVIAQNVYIPDTIFKNQLISVYGIDKNGDGEISYSEAAMVFNLYDLHSLGISDLTGIEAFINLRRLDCSYNNLTSLDVSNLHHLDTLYCYYNQIENIWLDTTNQGQMDNVRAQHNLLTKFSCYSIDYCDISWNAITELNTQWQFHTLNFSHNQSPLFLTSEWDATYLDLSWNTINEMYGGMSFNKLNLSHCLFPFHDLIFEPAVIYQLNCQSLSVESIDVSKIGNLNLLDITDCSNLKSICVEYLPPPFNIIDNNTDYHLYVCHPLVGNTFTAGQTQNTDCHLYVNLPVINNGNYDLDEDGFSDVEYYSVMEYSYPYWVNRQYMTPISPTKFGHKASGSLGFCEGEIINSIQNYWDYDIFHYWTSWSSPYGSFFDLNESYLAFRMANGNDTVHGWLQCGLTNTPVIKSYALWKPCNPSVSLGADTSVFQGDTIVLDAGEGYDNYFWNTLDTTQTISIYTGDYGPGTRKFMVYTQYDWCFYADTIILTILPNSCLPEGIIFSSQAEIDSFNQHYPGCFKIEGNLTISGSDIINLNPLLIVDSIGGILSVHDNHILASLSGLENINPNSINQLEIYSNDLLSLCNIENICTYLTNPDAAVNIHDNSTGCNTEVELRDSCNLLSVHTFLYDGNLLILPNPGNSSVTIRTKDGEYIEELVLYNQCGQMVLKEQPNDGEFILYKLKPGLFILEVTTRDWIVRKKLLIK